MGLGDIVEKALGAIGITEKRVEEWLGRPCSCGERKRKLNEIGSWASQVLLGIKPKEEMKSHLEEIVGEKLEETDKLPETKQEEMKPDEPTQPSTSDTPSS